jgi:hypothetical protein
MNSEAKLKEELERIRRVADLSCSGHAGLRDRYARMALALDLSIIASSTWLTALAFVAPHFNVTLTPFDADPQLWTGLLSVTTFLLSIVQFKTDWKGRSDAHRRTVAVYAEVKREAGYVLASGNWEGQASQRVFARYDMASAVGVEMPERFFLREKRRHRMKVAISRYLDMHPGASIALTRARFWMRDNFRRVAPHA